MLTIYPPRLLEILKVLVQQDDYISTSVLAEGLGVSNRTIFREIQDVNTLLDRFNMVLDSKSGKGVKLVGQQQDIHRLVSSLQDSYNTLMYRNVDERRQMLMLECLQNKQLSKLSNLASIFEVSEGTISRDLDVIEEWFNEYDLQLIRRQGYGVEVIGDEEKVRKAIIDVLHKHLALAQDYQAPTMDAYFKELDSGILSLLDKEVVSKVSEVLRNSSVKIAQRITEHSYIGLVIHLSVAIIRIQSGESINMNPSILESLEAEPLFREAKIIAGDIEDRFHITFPKAEVGYIMMHLKGTRPRKIAESTNDQNYDCLNIAENLIERFSSIVGEDFTNDEVLQSGLIAHLKPTLNRLKYELVIRNPLLNEIKSQYIELFEIVKETSKILWYRHDIQINDDEIGYLTLHFGAALERSKTIKQRRQSVNLGVVCASGIGISTLLASKLKSTFWDIGEVTALALEQVTDFDFNEIDLLVATLDVQAPVPIVFVNPLLKKEDIDLVRQEIDRIKQNNQQRVKLSQINLQQTINHNIIDRIKLYPIDLSQSKEAVIKSIITKSTNPLSQHEIIFERVMQREQMAPITIEEHQFVMFHASVPELAFPEVIFFRNNQSDNHEDFKGMEMGVLMIIPLPTDSLNRKTMSKVTQAIIDYEPLITALDAANENQLIYEINQYLKEAMYV